MLTKMRLHDLYRTLKFSEPDLKEDAKKQIIESIVSTILETKRIPHAKCAALGSISLNEDYIKEFEDAGFKFDLCYHNQVVRW